ncbi:hypothetical protein SLS58_007704 [Diplodia intermedia]|uniref:Uncharacterized protein n=1 Tax=Diplodia intermedia TaxID=856260 RepID=A0ABR3TJF3_9PEZI
MVTRTAPIDGSTTSIFTIFPSRNSQPTVILGTPAQNPLDSITPSSGSNAATGTPAVLGGASSSSASGGSPLATSAVLGGTASPPAATPLVTSPATTSVEAPSVLTLFQTSGSVLFTTLFGTMVSQLVPTTIVVVNYPTDMVFPTPSPTTPTLSMPAISFSGSAATAAAAASQTSGRIRGGPIILLPTPSSSSSAPNGASSVPTSSPSLPSLQTTVPTTLVTASRPAGLVTSLVPDAAACVPGYRQVVGTYGPDGTFETIATVTPAVSSV